MTADDLPLWDEHEERKYLNFEAFYERVMALEDNEQWRHLDDDDTPFDSGVDPYED